MSGERKDRLAATRRLRAALLTSSALALAWALPAAPSRAASDGTWLASPGSNDYRNGANWDGGFVPVGTASFGTSNTTSLVITSANVGGWTFNAGASNYTFDVLGQLTFSGAGIAVNATTFSGATTAATMTITNHHANVYFLGASSAGNATINNNAMTGPGYYFPANLQFGTSGGADTSTAGHATINNNGAFIYFYAATNAGTATIINQGQINFLDQSSAGGATITNNGAIYFGWYGGNENVTADNAVIINNDRSATYFLGTATAGSAVITTNSGGVTALYDNSTGGDAQFITNGTGYVDFSGSRGTNGDGRITAGSIAGSGFYSIGGGNTLVVGSNNLSTMVSGVISDFNTAPWCSCGTTGPGNLEKVGTGTLALSGTNTYTGTTVVNGGMLQVDGSIASSSLTTVNTGGALSGAGTVGNTVIASGGILLAGNGTPGSSLTVAGNLAFQSGALYLVSVNTSAASSVNVTGTATLGGAIGVSIATGSAVAKQYTLVSAAGGRSGTFTSFAVAGVPSGLAASLGYDAGHAYLNFALDYGTRTDLNTNQRTVAAALQNFFDANGGINAAFVGRSANGLTQLSGESATGSQQTTFGAMSQFMGLLTDPFVAGRDSGAGGGAAAVPFAEESASFADQARSSDARDAFASISRKAPHAESAFDQRWNVWAAGFGGSQTTSGNTVAGSANTTSSLYGTAVGADYRFSPDTIAGFALAGGGTSFSVSGLGWGRSDLLQAGAFLRHTIGPAYLTAALAYGWQDVTTDRIVTLAGVDRLRAEFNANAWSGRVEGGYRFVAPWTGGLGLTPYAAGQFTTFNLPAYAETVVSGNNTFALAYTTSSVTDARSELGLRTDKSFAMADAVLTLRGRAAWAHDFNPDRNVAATFQALPGASFVGGGARQAADSALTTASAEMKWTNGWSAAASFEGELSSVTRSYAGKGTVRYEW